MVCELLDEVRRRYLVAHHLPEPKHHTAVAAVVGRLGHCGVDRKGMHDLAEQQNLHLHR